MRTLTPKMFSDLKRGTPDWGSVITRLRSADSKTLVHILASSESGKTLLAVENPDMYRVNVGPAYTAKEFLAGVYLSQEKDYIDILESVLSLKNQVAPCHNAKFDMDLRPRRKYDMLSIAGVECLHINCEHHTVNAYAPNKWDQTTRDLLMPILRYFGKEAVSGESLVHLGQVK